MSAPLHILAISGSLKSTSSNTRILQELSYVYPENLVFTLFEGLESLPHFNPDKEKGDEAVQQFKQLLQQADGVVISTPEYAFGVPGVLKNALDWTVSSGELNEKPVIAISASPMYAGGDKAMASLLLTLEALGTRMEEGSHLSIPDILNKLNTEGRISDAATLSDLKRLVDRLLQTIQTSSSLKTA